MPPSTVPTPLSPSTLCPLQLVYPSDFRLTDKEVGPSPPRSRRRPGASRSSLGFLCFRKAASATCPSPTPTQVGDSASSLRPVVTGRARVGRGRPGAPLAQPGASQSVSASPAPGRGDTPSPLTQPWWPGHPSFVWQEGVSGQRDQRGLAPFTPQPPLPAPGCAGRLSPPSPVSRLPAAPAPLCAGAARDPRVPQRDARPPLGDPDPAGGASLQGSSPDVAWRGCRPSQAASGTRSSASAFVSVADRGAPGLPTTGSMTAGPPCLCR